MRGICLFMHTLDLGQALHYLLHWGHVGQSDAGQRRGAKIFVSYSQAAP